jgi:hypothetical protein
MPLTHEELSFLAGAHRVSITRAMKGAEGFRPRHPGRPSHDPARAGPVLKTGARSSLNSSEPAKCAGCGSSGPADPERPIPVPTVRPRRPDFQGVGVQPESKIRINNRVRAWTVQNQATSGGRNQNRCFWTRVADASSDIPRGAFPTTGSVPRNRPPCRPCPGEKPAGDRLSTSGRRATGHRPGHHGW